MPVNRHADQAPSETRPPSPNRELAGILQHHESKHKPWPEAMPRRAEVAALWWRERQEPRGKVEYQRRVPVAGNGKDSGQRWHDPYIERISSTLRKFLMLSHGRQRYILAAWEDGIPWRGEDTEHNYPQFEGRTLFENVVVETERMREIGVDAYRQECRQRTRKAIQHVKDMEGKTNGIDT